MVPQLLYAKNPANPAEIACAASLVPTFEAVAPQDAFEVVTDEKPVSTKLSDGSEFVFTFIVDRSGSMGFGSGRIELAKEALKLFVRSLPVGCKFQVVSFGHYFNLLLQGDQIKYDESSKDFALSAIERFQADMGGTDIYQPMNSVLADTSNQNLKQRVFLLTDGQVSNPQQVIDLARQHNETARVFSFGLGSGCDKNLVTHVA